LSNILSLRDL